MLSYFYIEILIDTLNITVTSRVFLNTFISAERQPPLDVGLPHVLNCVIFIIRATGLRAQLKLAISVL